MSRLPSPAGKATRIEVPAIFEAMIESEAKPFRYVGDGKLRSLKEDFLLQSQHTVMLSLHHRGSYFT